MVHRPDPDYRHAGIDTALRTSTQEQGLGADAVGTLARWLIDERGHHCLTIDPAAGNAVAIGCYRKASFHPVGVLRHYERREVGRWHDGRLMERLADELSSPRRARPSSPRSWRSSRATARRDSIQPDG